MLYVVNFMRFSSVRNIRNKEMIIFIFKCRKEIEKNRNGKLKIRG